MTNRCIAVLNYNRPVSNIEWFIKMYDKYEELEINDTLFICVSNNPRDQIPCDVYIEAPESVSESRNLILEKCIENGIKILHMVDDDISIEYVDMFDEYEKLYELIGVPYMSNGFTNSRNYVLNKPNPRLMFRLGRYGSGVDTVIFNAHHTNGYSFYDLETIGEYRYDPNLLVLEEDKYLFNLLSDGHVPYSTFLPDIDKSWTYIKRVSSAPIRKLTETLITNDCKYLADNGIKIEVVNDVDAVIRWTVDRLTKEKTE